jgi:hypothetical protein
MSDCTQSPILMLSNNATVIFLTYVIMRLALRQPDNVAKTRAVFAFLCVSIYTVVFGYGLPTKRNPLLFGGGGGF